MGNILGFFVLLARIFRAGIQFVKFDRRHRLQWPRSMVKFLILLLLSLTIFILNDRNVAKNSICFVKLKIFLEIWKTTNMKTPINLYRNKMLENKKFCLAVILAKLFFVVKKAKNGVKNWCKNVHPCFQYRVLRL